MASWFDYTINGLIVGNIYALLAIGLALIFGVSHLINFAHGSVYMVGGFIGWLCLSRLGLPLPFALLATVSGCALLGIAIERIGLRPLQGAARITPLLATIGISFVLDQLAQIVFGPDPRPVPSSLPQWTLMVGGASLNSLDALIAAIGIGAAAVLYAFLRFTRLGWAVRATAQDRDAAQQMGVNVHAVNRAVFAIACGLGGLSGLLVGMYYNSIDPAMGFQATLKGVVALLIGGLGNVPGAIVGSLLLGLVESYGVALFGTSYRDLFAFALLLLFLVLRPNGLFSSSRRLPPEPLTGTFLSNRQAVRLSPRAVGILLAIAFALPIVAPFPYLLQTLTNGWIFGLLALSLTLVAGTVGQISLGHAALLLIGAYASALLSAKMGLTPGITILLAGVVTAAIGTLLIYPSFRLRGHYVSIATLGIGEIVGLVILNWDSLTRGPIGVTGIAPLSLFGWPLSGARSAYWFTLAILVALALLQLRLLRSHLGRTWRAIREDDVAARAYGVRPNRYKAIAFACGGLSAGIGGAIAAHLYSYINYQTFDSQVSILGLTMVILGGLGNVPGAIVGSVALVGLPELFRFAADYRMLVYGVVLLLLVRFRPQGLFGAV
ncbi:amino acid/amide ABC transporter membrane protein 1 (HAAT family) [Trinickia symbiotica]|uniref:ABC transporter permease n=1 Tax=Trinickia symbiotica TaxID=863227 RepID=A0A2N7WS20_9BURK|nr:ABC transporter permease [Trinickia symbiotica]PMS32210.1 ABC transporter permease [Trinickia symbiotica]PPK45238.1 amino acid/amide ABC transporter membrane protein 1 (HAAT family) [Trinickia symbiotica]